MASDKHRPQVQIGIHQSHDPVLVDIKTQGSGRIRVLLNGVVVYEGDSES
jgi:hypothetical protein